MWMVLRKKRRLAMFYGAPFLIVINFLTPYMEAVSDKIW